MSGIFNIMNIELHFI